MWVVESVGAAAVLAPRESATERGSTIRRELVARAAAVVRGRRARARAAVIAPAPTAAERRLARLGFDLHDGPLQEIVALAEELRLAARQVVSLVPEEDRARVGGRFDDLHARLGSLDTSLREIASATRSTTAAAPQVVEALESELEALERATGIATELEVDGDVSELTDSQKIALFRVVQEAASNIRKHSGAGRASVALQSTRTWVHLTITDDGCGFDLGDRAHDRLGLAGIAERVRLLGGVVEIDSRRGAGTVVRATLPQWRPSSQRFPSLAGRGS